MSTILSHSEHGLRTSVGYSPAVNFIKDMLTAGGSVAMIKVLRHPVNQVVLENTLGDLMQKIRCNELVDVRPWKTNSVWLANGQF